MTSMSYCRMHNTLRELQACYEHMTDRLDNTGNYDSEYAQRDRLIALCIRIAREFSVEGKNGALEQMDAQLYEEDEECEA